ncbi:MAG: tetratricopeptide repeat protein [Campylobacterales bacterium]
MGQKDLSYLLVASIVTLPGIAAESISPLTISVAPVSIQKSEAISLFKANKHQEACRIVEQLYEQQTDDKDINYYLGRCAFEAKDYDSAIAAYERVLIVEPENVLARFEMARSLMESGQDKEAIAEFEELRELPLPEDYRKVVNTYLEALVARQQKHFITGLVMAGIQYDNNLNSGNNKTASTPKSDYSYTGIAYLAHTYSPQGKVKGLFWNSSAMIYQQQYAKSSNQSNDVRMLQLTSGPQWKGIKANISFPFEYSYLWIGEGSFYHTFAVGPKITFPMESRTIDLAAKITQKDHLRHPSYGKMSERDSYLVDASLSLQQILMDGSIIINGSIAWQHEACREGYAPMVDQNNYTLTAGLTYMATAALSVSASESLKYSRYFNDAREDYNNATTLSATWKMTKSLSVVANTTYTANNSTIMNYDYTKTVASASLMYLF